MTTWSLSWCCTFRTDSLCRFVCRFTNTHSTPLHESKAADTTPQKPCEATHNRSRFQERYASKLFDHRHRVGIIVRGNEVQVGTVSTCSCSTWASNLSAASKLASCAASSAVASACGSGSKRSKAQHLHQGRQRWLECLTT